MTFPTFDVGIASMVREALQPQSAIKAGQVIDRVVYARCHSCA